MAIPQRKTRLISIDGFEYRWLITFHRNAPFYRIITVAVELSSSPGTKLVVYPIGVDVNFVDYDRDEPITPKIVEEFIRRAIGNGWTPTASSGTFVLGDPSIATKAREGVAEKPKMRNRVRAILADDPPHTT